MEFGKRFIGALLLACAILSVFGEETSSSELPFKTPKECNIYAFGLMRKNLTTLNQTLEHVNENCKNLKIESSSTSTIPTLPPTTTPPQTSSPPTISTTPVTSLLPTTDSGSSPSPPSNTSSTPLEDVTDDSASTQNGLDAESTTVQPIPEVGEERDDGVSHLAWSLPVIALLLIIMGVGGFYIHRYTKRPGFRHSAKTNGDAGKSGTESA